jgi:predicted site-specific integrase-resolvase
MPVILDGKTYYRTNEVCQTVGVSRNTLFRWLAKGNFEVSEYRDWRGWRLISEDQVRSMKQKTSQVMIQTKSLNRQMLQ